MEKLITQSGRRFCRVCFAYIGTNVETPRCLHHAQSVICPWCRGERFTTPAVVVDAHCSVPCRRATKDFRVRDVETKAKETRLKTWERRLEVREGMVGNLELVVSLKDRKEEVSV